MAGKIFVNYRRDDSAANALSVAQYLEREFGASNVFLDIDRIRAGQKFPKVLEERLSVSKVMLVVIGPLWLAAAKETGERRLDDPEDWVRMEIARALARGITVIPLLVGGAALPKKSDLPVDLQELVSHHVAIITTNGFRNEMAGLARDIRAEIGGPPWTKIAVAGLLVAVATLAGFLVLKVPESASPETSLAEQRTAITKPMVQSEAVVAKREKEQEFAARGNSEDVRTDRAETEHGRLFSDCSTCPAMVVVRAGKFLMGSPETEDGRDAGEGAPQRVTIAEPFAMSRHEITRAQYAAFAEATRRSTQGGCWQWNGTDWKERADGSWREPGFAQRDDHPVTCVSWDDGKAYAAWISLQTGRYYRLPTEVEWEYGARAGSTTAYSTGASIAPDQANFAATRRTVPGGTTAVGSFAPNPFGLYDMHGNLWEWIQDCYETKMRAAQRRDAATQASCATHTLRGGSWVNQPRDLRSAERFGLPVADRNHSVGFRLTASLSNSTSQVKP